MIAQLFLQNRYDYMRDLIFDNLLNQFMSLWLWNIASFDKFFALEFNKQNGTFVIVCLDWYRMFVGTWNVGGKSPHEDLNMREWLRSPTPADIYVLG